MSSTARIRGGRYRTDENMDLLDRITQLEERLAKLERTPSLPSSGVNQGGIVVKGGGVVVIRDDGVEQGNMQLGSDVFVNSESGMALSIYRSQAVPGEVPGLEGSQALQIDTVDGSASDPTFTFPNVNVYDKSGGTIFADGTNARRGMSEPRLGVPWSGPFIATTNNSYSGDIGKSEWSVYHPHLLISVEVSNDGGTSSELRVTDGGSGLVVAGPTGQGSGFVGFVTLTVKRSSLLNGMYPNGNGNLNLIFVEFRRAGGAGTARARIVSQTAMDNTWFTPE